MDVFLSYASEERPLAERVCRVLETEGHEVFFDRDDLGGGDAFGERIRKAIASCDVLVYLISRQSVAPRSYALTELAIAAALSKRQRPAILPVRTDDTPIDAVPPTLRAYTILEPQGDAPAEIALAIDRLRTLQRQQRVRIAAAVALAALVAVGAALFIAWGTPDGEAPPREPPKVAGNGTPVAADPVAVPDPVAPRDPIEELNEAILKRTPEDRRVTVTGMPGNGGWTGVLILADRTATQVSYRLDGESTFTNTGSTGIPNAMTGAPLPNTSIQMPGAFWRPRTVSVKYTDMKGREHGPYDVAFDPRAQFLQFTRQALGNMSWVDFQNREPGRPLLYFTALLSFKAAFKEIRYSLDSDALDRTWPFKVSASDGWPAPIGDDELFITVPPATKFVTVRIVYIDGKSDTRRINAP